MSLKRSMSALYKDEEDSDKAGRDRDISHYTSPASSQDSLQNSYSLDNGDDEEFGMYRDAFDEEVEHHKQSDASIVIDFSPRRVRKVRFALPPGDEDAEGDEGNVWTDRRVRKVRFSLPPDEEQGLADVEDGADSEMTGEDNEVDTEDGISVDDEDDSLSDDSSVTVTTTSDSDPNECASSYNDLAHLTTMAHAAQIARRGGRFSFSRALRDVDSEVSLLELAESSLFERRAMEKAKRSGKIFCASRGWGCKACNRGSRQ